MSNHIHSYSKLQDVIYGSSDVLFFNRGINYYKNQKIKNFITVIGGMSFLNFVTLINPQKIFLFDINPYVIKYCKLILRIIENSKTKEDFLNSLKKGNYKINDKDELHMKEILKYMGKSKPEKKGPGWTFNIPNNGNLLEKKEKKRGIQLGHPLRSWKFALDNFYKLKKNLQNADVNFTTLNVFDSNFKKNIKEENTWIYFSNIFQVLIHNDWMTNYELFLDKPRNIVILDETTPILEINENCLTKIIRNKNGWQIKKEIKLI